MPVTSPVKRNRTTSSANYESSPAQILTSLQTVMSVSLPGSEPGTPAGSISCPQVSLLAGQVSASDLIGPLLAEAVSQQSVGGAAKYLMLCHTRLREEEAVCGKRATVPPLSNIISVTRSQIVMTLSNVVRGVYHTIIQGQSPLYPLVTDDQCPPDLLGDLVSLLAPDQTSFSSVFTPVLQHCLMEATRSRLVSPRFQITSRSNWSRRPETQRRMQHEPKSSDQAGQPTGHVISPLPGVGLCLVAVCKDHKLRSGLSPAASVSWTPTSCSSRQRLADR